MTNEEILEIVKFNLGITLDGRDPYLLSIIRGARAELKQSGISPDGQTKAYKANYDMYLADYCSYLYRNRGGEGALPRHLQFRRHNLIMSHV